MSVKEYLASYLYYDIGCSLHNGFNLFEITIDFSNQQVGNSNYTSPHSSNFYDRLQNNKLKTSTLDTWSHVSKGAYK